MKATALPLNQNAHPWYKQYWPWFLLALPSIAVIACFISISIATRHSDSVLDDAYFREGLALRSDGGQDRAAAQRHLRADLSIDANGAISLALDQRNASRPARLMLQFLHPFDSGGDCKSALRIDGDRYRGTSCAATGRFTVELRDPASDWRLRARITLPRAQALRLQP